MRILLTVYGTRPHIYPLVPLAWAFRVAGHEVRLASTPMWAKEMADTGLSPVIVGGSPEVSRAERDAIAEAQYSQPSWPTDWVTNVSRLDREKWAYLESLGRYLVAAASAMVDDLVAFAKDWGPDAIVYDTVSYAGPVAAAVSGAAPVRFLTGMDAAQRLELTQPGPQPLPEYAALFERFGASVPIDPPSIVDPTPPSMRLDTPPRLFGMRYVPYNGRGMVPSGLVEHRSRPCVCITWGHSMSAAIGAAGALPFLQVVQATTELGMDCIVMASPTDLEGWGPLPESVRVLTSVPLQLVLPYCDLIVHQGGDGTALTAAAAAVPQLAIGGNPEADLCGGRLVAVGVGNYLRYPDLRADPDSRVVIRDAVEKLLSDTTYADAAGRLRAEIESQPAPAEVAAWLAELVSRPTGGKPCG